MSTLNALLSACLAEQAPLLATTCERVAQWDSWLHPQRDRSRKTAPEWLAGSRMTDSLSLYPKVGRIDAMRTTGALRLTVGFAENEPDETRPCRRALRLNPQEQK